MCKSIHWTLIDACIVPGIQRWLIRTKSSNARHRCWICQCCPWTNGKTWRRILVWTIHIEVSRCRICRACRNAYPRHIILVESIWALSLTASIWIYSIIIDRTHSYTTFCRIISILQGIHRASRYTSLSGRIFISVVTCRDIPRAVSNTGIIHTVAIRVITLRAQRYALPRVWISVDERCSTICLVYTQPTNSIPKLCRYCAGGPAKVRPVSRISSNISKISRRTHSHAIPCRWISESGASTRLIANMLELICVPILRAWRNTSPVHVSESSIRARRCTNIINVVDPIVAETSRHAGAIQG